MGKINRSSWKREGPEPGQAQEEPAEFFRREFDIDIISTYKRLRGIATLSVDKLRDRMELSRMINSSAQNAHDANKIFLKARAEREMFRIEFSKEMRTLNRESVTEIEAWMKANGVKNKKITKDMVEQELASNQSLRERYKDLLLKQEDLREIRDNCKSLAEQWSDRKGLLQTQAGLLKQEREVVFGNRAEDGSVGYRTRD